MHNRRGATLLFGAIFFVLFLPWICRAQEGQSDLGEVSGYIGVAYGGYWSRPSFGGSAGVTLDRYAIALLECAFEPLDHETLGVRPAPLVSSSGLYEINFAVHIRVPLKHKWEPYAILAPALLYNRYQTGSVQPNGTVVYVSGQGVVKFGFETGGGARYYAGRHWGLRGEYRYTICSRNFNRVVFGVFRQF